MGLSLTDEEIDALFAEMDQDGSGSPECLLFLPPRAPEICLRARPRTLIWPQITSEHACACAPGSVDFDEFQHMVKAHLQKACESDCAACQKRAPNNQAITVSGSDVGSLVVVAGVKSRV